MSDHAHASSKWTRELDELFEYVQLQRGRSVLVVYLLVLLTRANQLARLSFNLQHATRVLMLHSILEFN